MGGSVGGAEFKVCVVEKVFLSLSQPISIISEISIKNSGAAAEDQLHLTLFSSWFKKTLWTKVNHNHGPSYDHMPEIAHYSFTI